jgi:hypothetical protein
VNIPFSHAITFLALLIFFPNTIPAREIPVEVGGFVLGSDVTDYPDIEYSNFLKEVVIYDWHGFDKGIISYGICDSPGEIVKIKLKYEDSSKKFFQTLLKRYKKKYGKPDEWKGDAFGILHIWKWTFTDKNNKRIQLILQHNTKNPNENLGNMVKLYCPDQIIREQKCFTKTCDSHMTQDGKGGLILRKKKNWKYLIPQAQQ